MDNTTLVGKVFGRFTILEERGKNKYGRQIALCVCECGKQKVVEYNNLVNGNSKSCGCYRKEVTRDRSKTHGKTVGAKSGERPSAEYSIWIGIKERCYRKNCNAFKWYGATGVIMSDRWKNSFENFLLDMGKRPSPEHSIDRFPNQKGNYEPNNCRWATMEQQSRNKTTNNWLEHEGVKMVLADWAKELKVSSSQIKYQLLSKSFGDAVYYFKNKMKRKGK